MPERLLGRRSLLGELDAFRRTLDHDEAMQGMDSFTQRAFEVLGFATGIRGTRLDQGRPAASRARMASATCGTRPMARLAAWTIS